MSQTQNYSIRCPQCTEEQDVELYESVNVQNEPELRQLVMTDELNGVTCDHCGFSFRVDKSLLYNDPLRKFMINLLPGQGPGSEERQSAFLEWVREINGALPEGMEGPEVHLVFSRTELVERIFLLEAGLNERIIEYVKYTMYSRNLERLDPAHKKLLFNAEDSTEENLCFVVQDVQTRALEGILHYNRAAYDGLCEMFDHDEQTPSLMELFPGPHVSARELLLKDVGVEEHRG